MNFEKYIKSCPCGSGKSFHKCCEPKKLHKVFQFPEGQEPQETPDWRIAVISQIMQDVPPAFVDGPSHKKGSFVSMIHSGKHSRYGTLGFTTPNATALSLSAAVKNACIATELKAQLILGDIQHGKIISPNNIFYDYIEHFMATINFAFQATETFCNSVLARMENIQTIEIKDGKVIKTLTKKEVERTCSTEDKLLLVLPQLLGLKKPKDTLQWYHFKILKKLRDDIVHMKARDMYSKAPGDSSTLFYEMYESHPLAFPKMAFELIWLYSQSSVPGHNQPPWARRFIEYFATKAAKYY